MPEAGRFGKHRITAQEPRGGEIQTLLAKIARRSVMSTDKWEIRVVAGN
jgi:hypothetical protein